MMYWVLMCTKNKSNQSTVQRETETKLCTNLPPDICTRYETCFVSRPWGLHSARARLEVWPISVSRGCTESGGVFFKSTEVRDNYTDQWRNVFLLGFCHVEGYRDFNADQHKHRLHSDNLPIHSAKCSCSEYDGVLLLIIIITVMVIINNYLMVWCSFTWWDLSVYCF